MSLVQKWTSEIHILRPYADKFVSQFQEKGEAKHNSRYNALTMELE
jgi:hypothetical protein